MDFDEIDDLEVPFAELVAQARQEVLHDVPVSQQWSLLVEKHDFFKDMVAEAKTRGQQMGPLLIAAAGVTDAITRHATGAAHSAVGASSFCTIGEAQVLAALSDVYNTLFSASPVPSANAWASALRSRFLNLDTPPLSFADDALATHSAGPLAALETCVSQSTTLYLAPVAAVVCGDEAVTNADEDDGTLVDRELKAFLRRCLQLGRKCTRSEAGTPHLKAMLSTVSNFLTNTTLDW